MDGTTTPENEIPPESFIPNTEREVTYQDIAAAKTVKHQLEGDQVTKPHEDRILFAPEQRAFGVFDGLGAHGNGDKAAQYASEFIAEQVKHIPPGLSAEEVTEDYLFLITEELNRQIPTEASGLSTMAFGIVYETADNKEVFITLTVGDSRIYRLRDGRLTYLTIDNEDPSKPRSEQRARQTKFSNIRTIEEIDALPDDEREAFRQRNALSQALGGQEQTITPFMDIHDIKEDDVILLVTDGICNNLTDKEIEEIMNTYPDPKTAVDQLILKAQAVANDQTNIRRSKDDMSAQVVKKLSSLPKRDQVSAIQDTETWLTIPDTTLEIPEIQTAEANLGRALTVSEQYFLMNGGTEQLLTHVEPVYRQLRRARNHLLSSEDWTDFKQYETGERTDTYNYIDLKRLVTLARVELTSKDEIEVYGILQGLDDANKAAVRDYYTALEGNKPADSTTTLEVTFRRAMGQMVPMLSSTYKSSTTS